MNRKYLMNSNKYSCEKCNKKKNINRKKRFLFLSIDQTYYQSQYIYITDFIHLPIINYHKNDNIILFMIISKFDTKNCEETTTIINELFLDRGIKQMINNSTKPNIAVGTNQVSTKKFEPFEIKKEICHIANKKLIQTVKSKHKLKKIKQQIKMQEKYNNWLKNYLLRTGEVQINRDINPPLSILETKEQQDYPTPDNEQSVYKKDYPHYSNILKLNEIATYNNLKKQKFIFLNIPMKMNAFDKNKNVFKDVCVKYHTILKFISKYLIYKEDTFEKIADELSISVKNAKLMFDILNDIFKLEKKSEKLQRFRNKQEQYDNLKSNIKTKIHKWFQSKKSVSEFIPNEQLYVNLEQLHEMVLKSIDLQE